MNIHTLDGLSPTNEPIDIRLRPSADLSSSPSYRAPPRPIPIPLPDPLSMSQRPPLDLDHPDPVEPLRNPCGTPWNPCGTLWTPGVARRSL